MRLGIRCGPMFLAALLLLGASSLLSACAFSEAETPRQKAFALGVEYGALQEAAATYLESGNPSPLIADAIAGANATAAGLVKATIRQAMRTDAATAAAENEEAAPAGTGLSPAENAAAQGTAFDRLFGLARAAVSRLSALMGGA